MKKYRLIKDLGVFKKGMEFERLGEGLSNYVELNLNDTTNLQIHNDHIKYFLEQGIIEEVQEPEYSKDDMISILKFFYDTNYNNTKDFNLHTYFKVEDVFQQWQEQRK